MVSITCREDQQFSITAERARKLYSATDRRGHLSTASCRKCDALRFRPARHPVAPGADHATHCRNREHTKRLRDRRTRQICALSRTGAILVCEAKARLQARRARCSCFERGDHQRELRALKPMPNPLHAHQNSIRNKDLGTTLAHTPQPAPQRPVTHHDPTPVSRS